MFNRTVELQGTKNTRDLGGLTRNTGDQTKFGIFIRSDSIANLTLHDFSVLKRNHIETVIDMRTKQEAQKTPTYITDDKTIRYHWAPIELNSQCQGELCLSTVYINVLEKQKDALRMIFNYFSEAQGLCLFNCNGGKDRTGIVSMILLDIADVEQKYIVDDYLETAVNMRVFFSEVKQKIINNECDIPIAGLECLPEFVISTLSYIKQRYLSSWNYLNSIGVRDCAISKILERFISE